MQSWEEWRESSIAAVSTAVRVTGSHTNVKQDKVITGEGGHSGRAGGGKRGGAGAEAEEEGGMEEGELKCHSAQCVHWKVEILRG